MNRFLFVSSSSSSSLFSKASSHFINTTYSSFSCFSNPLPSSSLSLLWRGRVNFAAIKPTTLHFPLTTRFHVQLFSSASRPPKSRKAVPGVAPMEEEKHAFYVVRKGDMVGVYKTLSDCQAQVGSSVCDPSVSVYKGYSLATETEEYLRACGLKNALYSVRAADVNEDLFGALIPCPFQQPDSKGTASNKPSTTPASKSEASKKISQSKRTQAMLEIENNAETSEASYFWAEILRKQAKLNDSVTPQAVNRKCDVMNDVEGCREEYHLEIILQHRSIVGAAELKALRVSCTLEFDGAAKGNPGLAGAGAILRADDGSLVCKLREGLGIATNNVAEYKALILALKHAHSKGFLEVRIQGDSKLVCNQVQGLWKVKNDNMAKYCNEAKELMKKFSSVKVDHVLRDFNSGADDQANLAVSLAEGQVREDCEEK